MRGPQCFWRETSGPIEFKHFLAPARRCGRRRDTIVCTHGVRRRGERPILVVANDANADNTEL